MGLTVFVAGARGSGRKNRGLLESIVPEEATDAEFCAAIATDVSKSAGVLPSDVSCSPKGNGYFGIVVTFRTEGSSEGDIVAFTNALSNNPDGIFGSFPPGTMAVSDITVTFFEEDPGGYESLFYGMLYGIEFVGQPPTPLPPVPTATPEPPPTPAPTGSPAPTTPAPTSDTRSCGVGGDVAAVAHADLDAFVPISALNPLSTIVVEAPCGTRRKLLDTSGDMSEPDSVPPCSMVVYTDYAFTCAASVPKEETCLVAFVVFPEDVDQDSLDAVMETMGNDPATIFTSFDDQAWELDAFFGPFQSQMRLSSALPAECCPGNADQPSFCSSGTSDGSSSSDAQSAVDPSMRAGDDLLRLLENSSENERRVRDEDSSHRRDPNNGRDDDDTSEERDRDKDSKDAPENSSERRDPEKGRGDDDDEGDDDDDDDDGAGKENDLGKGSDDHENSSERRDPEKGRGNHEGDDDDDDDDDEAGAGEQKDIDKGNDDHKDSSEQRDPEKGRGNDEGDDDDADDDDDEEEEVGAGEQKDVDKGSDDRKDSSERRDPAKGTSDDEGDDEEEEEEEEDGAGEQKVRNNGSDDDGAKGMEDEEEDKYEPILHNGAAAIINSPAMSQPLDPGMPETAKEPTLADFVPVKAENQEGNGPRATLAGLQAGYRAEGEELIVNLTSGGANQGAVDSPRAGDLNDTDVDVPATNVSSPMYPTDASDSNATAGFLLGPLPGEGTALDPALYTVLSGRDPVELTKDGGEPLVNGEIPAFMRANDGGVDLETRSEGGVDLETRSVVEFAQAAAASGPIVDGGRKMSTAVGAIVACAAFSILAAGCFILRRRLSEGLRGLRRRHRLRPADVAERTSGAAWTKPSAHLPGNARRVVAAPPWEERAPDRI